MSCGISGTTCVNQTRNTVMPTRVPDTLATQTEGNDREQGTPSHFCNFFAAAAPSPNKAK